MKPKFVKFLSVFLAAILQFLPMLRSVLPTAANPGSAFIFRWAAGGLAYFGYHAISSASSIIISPAVATIGSPYNGTITYSGGHAGQVSSMAISNSCMSSSRPFTPGLTIIYSGGNTATVSGTPTGATNTIPFTLTVYDASSCGSGHTDSRSYSITYQNAGGAASSPTITVAPQSIVAQVGSDLLLSGGAIGNPSPQYYWRQGITPIPGVFTNILSITNARLTNAGAYSLIASNTGGTANGACYVTMALTPGSNILGLDFTNYIVAGTPLTMTSFITNVPSGVSTYAWSFNNVPIGVTTSNLNLTTAQTIPSKSGIYSINFNSTVSGTQVVSNQSYDSYWMFGHLPVVTNQPSPVTVGSGSNATFNATLAGSSFGTVFWYRNATNLVATQTNLTQAYNPSSATATTNFSLTLSNVSAGNAGNYTVVVTNFWGSTTSSAALLTVTSALSVSAPQGQTNYAGKTINLSVIAAGTPPLTYQWQNSGANLSNGGNISGANTNTLTLAPAAVTNSGNYAVIITNSSGSITSSVAALSIVPVPALGIVSGTTNVTLNAGSGVAGSPYIVQYSTNLSSSVWTSLFTNTVPTNGVINYTDTNTSNSSLRFYRVNFP